jgi:hypothetical protein
MLTLMTLVRKDGDTMEHFDCSIGRATGGVATVLRFASFRAICLQLWARRSKRHVLIRHGNLLLDLSRRLFSHDVSMYVRKIARRASMVVVYGVRYSCRVHALCKNEESLGG